MNRTFLIALVVSTALLVGAGAARVQGQSSPMPTAQAKAEPAASAQKAEKAQAATRLSADQAYKANCTRCHSELPKLDARAMKTVLMHMQVRANMPKDEARAILDYLTR